MNSKEQARFMYLFERVGEPLYLGPRGEKNTYYMVPTDYLDEKTQHAAKEYRKNMQSTGTSIPVKSPAQRPNLSVIGNLCPKSALFSYFIPSHRNAANELRRILMSQPNLDDFLSIACVCRDSESVNPRLWIYSFASSALLRPDLKKFKIPALWEIMPDQFVSPDVIRMAQQQAVRPEADRSIIEVARNLTGDDTNPENRLSYFREDIGINSHHWHYHLIYPTSAPANKRDRKGELFYYMHHGMIARYDAERLCNRLGRVKRLEIDQPIEEGYFPKLYDTNAGVIWGTRQEMTRLRNVERASDPRASLTLDLNDLKTWRSRIEEAIDTGVVLGENGQRISLTHERGIDILGDLMEAANISPNMRLYGDFHNSGHVAIAASHDPAFRHRENLGTMGDVSTAMRDPAFYRWHKLVDEIFDKYKATLTPYTAQELTWNGITVTDISVSSPSRREGNILVTNWMQSDVDLARGLDFGRTNNLGPIFARITHLNHEAFTYRIAVTNSGTQEKLVGTVRIFMAPRLNEHGSRFDMANQRTLYFEMDKFSTNLRPGQNIIERRSIDSSVSIPWESTFRDLERTLETPEAEDSVCGCGWPQHMLLPRGTPEGLIFDLYVIITDGALDAVPRRNPTVSSGQKQGCRDAVSYCGLLDELYPDKKPMGYPFDRFPRLDNNRPLANIDAFTKDVPNSRTTQIRIIYRDETFIRSGGAPGGMPMIQAGSRPTSPTNSRPSSPTPQPTPAPVSPPPIPKPKSPPPTTPVGTSTGGGRTNNSKPTPPTSKWPPSGGRPTSTPTTSTSSSNRGGGGGYYGSRRPSVPYGHYGHNYGYNNDEEDEDDHERSPSPTGWTHVPSRHNHWGGWTG